MAAAATALTLLTGAPADAQSDLKVVATASPLFDVASSIGGDNVKATDLVPLDMFGEVPIPKEKVLAEADIVIRLAPGVQPEIDRAMARLNPDATVVNVLDSFVDTTSYSEPYIWQDPSNMLAVTQIVRDAFTQARPKAAEDFEENQQGLVHVYSDVEILNSRTLATCERRDVVVTKPGFSYLTRRFGLNEVAAAPGRAAQAVNERHATTIFSRELPPLEEAQAFREQTGARSAVLDPMTSRTDQIRRGGGNWQTIMGVNLDALRYGLGCEKVELGDD